MPGIVIVQYQESCSGEPRAGAGSAGPGPALPAAAPFCGSPLIYTLIAGLFACGPRCALRQGASAALINDTHAPGRRNALPMPARPDGALQFGCQGPAILVPCCS